MGEGAGFQPVSCLNFLFIVSVPVSLPALPKPQPSSAKMGLRDPHSPSVMLPLVQCLENPNAVLHTSCKSIAFKMNPENKCPRAIKIVETEDIPATCEILENGRSFHKKTLNCGLDRLRGISKLLGSMK